MASFVVIRIRLSRLVHRAVDFPGLRRNGTSSQIINQAQEFLEQASWHGNLANFMRTLALPKEVEHWSLTMIREKLVKMGAKVVAHGRYVTFQMAEVTVSRRMFGQILSRIARLRTPPAPA